MCKSNYIFISTVLLFLFFSTLPSSGFTQNDLERRNLKSQVKGLSEIYLQSGIRCLLITKFNEAGYQTNRRLFQESNPVKGHQGQSITVYSDTSKLSLLWAVNSYYTKTNKLSKVIAFQDNRIKWLKTYDYDDSDSLIKQRHLYFENESPYGDSSLSIYSINEDTLLKRNTSQKDNLIVIDKMLFSELKLTKRITTIFYNNKVTTDIKDYKYASHFQLRKIYLTQLRKPLKINHKTFKKIKYNKSLLIRKRVNYGFNSRGNLVKSDIFKTKYKPIIHPLKKVIGKYKRSNQKYTIWKYDSNDNLVSTNYYINLFDRLLNKPREEISQKYKYDSMGNWTYREEINHSTKVFESDIRKIDYYH